MICMRSVGACKGKTFPKLSVTKYDTITLIIHKSNGERNVFINSIV